MWLACLHLQPQAGFNGDKNLCADQTKLDQPLAVGASGQAIMQYAVADSGNARVRLLAPSPTKASTACSAVSLTGAADPEATATHAATVTPHDTPTAMPTSTETAATTLGASATPAARRTPIPTGVPAP
jgi:hypothetical protein